LVTEVYKDHILKSYLVLKKNRYAVNKTEYIKLGISLKKTNKSSSSQSLQS